jgi:Permuted papain-like amidase enzyme, YaeF/YiiX, C92 family
MKKLKESSLRVGDIILTSSTGNISKAIRKGTKSDISHAMIYVQSHSIIDSDRHGVHAQNTQRLHFEDELAIHVYRMRRELTDAEALRISNYARAAVGTEYALGEALKAAREFLRGKKATSTRKQFCSRLAARAYAFAGIKLVKDPHYCTPQEFKHSPDLVEVMDVTETITQAQIDRLESVPDSTLRMRDVTNTLLRAARTCSPAIQDLNDIDQHLIAHPEDDAYMCRALKESGYLTHWKVEVAKYPWRYEIQLMNAVTDKAEVEAYCQSTLADEPIGSHRYVVNHGGYVAYSTRYSLRYFELKLKLYELLASLHKARLDVAKQWLVNNSLLAPAEPPALRPHSPEWFKALEVWNPKQAAITKYITQRMGSRDVCSLCGDDPAKDYRLPATHRPLGAVDTLRLCDGCLGIRRGMGEPYDLLSA